MKGFGRRKAVRRERGFTFRPKGAEGAWLFALCVFSFRCFAMLEPGSLPKGAGFEYFAESPAMVGVPGHVAWMDGFGSLRSEDVDLLFFLGEKLQPHALGAKRLEGDSLPILSASCLVEGLQYDFESFSSPVPEVEHIPCLHFVSIAVTNRAGRVQACPLAVACRCAANDGNMSALSAASYRFQEEKALLNDRVLYVGPRGGELLSVHGVPYQGPFTGSSLRILPSTPVLWRVYRPVLERGERRRFHFILPSPGISLREPKLVSILDMLQPEAYRERVVSRWRSFLDAGASIQVDEPKVCQSLEANIVYGYLLDSLPEAQIEDPARLGSVWISCLGAIALDVTGHFEEAKALLMSLMSRCESSSELDANALIERCQISWAMGYHTRVTRDMGFARAALQLLEECTAGLEAKDLDPKVEPWIMLASREAGWLSEFIGEQELAGRFRALSSSSSDFTVFSGEGDRHEWLLQLALGVFDPREEPVGTSIDAVRKRWMSEGVLVSKQGELLPATTAMLALTHLARKEEESGLHAFYSMLLHTSSSHVGVDGGIKAWGRRNVSFPVPHRGFSHLLVLLTRCMMAREEGSSLHLLSSVAPRWMSPGSKMELRNMPTRFGPLHLSVTSQKNRGHILLETAFFEDPEEVFLHLPWFLDLRSAHSSVDAVQRRGNTLVLRPESQEIKLRWDRKSVSIDFDRVVQNYEAEYERRFQRFKREGGEAYVPRTEPLLDFQQRADRYRAISPSAWQNLASVKRVRVGREGDEHPSPKLLWDGDPEGAAWTSGTCPQWVLLELEGLELLEAVRIHMPNAPETQCRYDLHLSSDGRDWHAAAREIRQNSLLDPSCLTVFSPRKARFVRITWNEANPGGSVSVTEVELIKVCPERPFSLVHNCALKRTVQDVSSRTYPDLVNGSLLPSEAVSAEFMVSPVVDLGSERTVCGVGIWCCGLAKDADLVLHLSSDREQWVPAGSLKLRSKSNFSSVEFPKTLCRYVRAAVPSQPLAFVEWEVYCCP